jgi:hypothetical protein
MTKYLIQYEINNESLAELITSEIKEFIEEYKNIEKLYILERD